MKKTELRSSAEIHASFFSLLSFLIAIAAEEQRKLNRGRRRYIYCGKAYHHFYNTNTMIITIISSVDQSARLKVPPFFLLSSLQPW